MNTEQVIILSVAELRSRNLSFLKSYKADVLKAKVNAATPMDQEQWTNQLERVNCILNEAEAVAIMESEEKEFAKLQCDIESALLVALDNLKPISQNTNTGTSSKLVVATAERPALEERV